MDRPEKKEKIIKRLRNKYRLVVLNSVTFAERFSVELSPLNVIAVVGATFFLCAAIFISIIVFTPIKELIPGYADNSLKERVINTAIKADSLQEELRKREFYVSNLLNILQGNPSQERIEDPSELYSKPKSIDFKRSKDDSILRAKIESEERYSVSAVRADNTKEKVLSHMSLFAPIRGSVTDSFDPENRHFGTDVVSPLKNEAIKSVYEGMVIFASWTSDYGFVIQVQHENDLISVYKHNSVLLKTVGDAVSAGDAIAIMGNTGELTTGPHLHFEIWHKGEPINPENYIAF
jgi:murein DD-endopeptidase MepM/ murein hydrolase activator NlpD